MSVKFKVGDMVRVVKILKDDFICGSPDSPYAYKGKCGLITKAYDGVWNYDIEVMMGIDGETICFIEDELELVVRHKISD